VLAVVRREYRAPVGEAQARPWVPTHGEPHTSNQLLTEWYAAEHRGSEDDRIAFGGLELELGRPDR